MAYFLSLLRLTNAQPRRLVHHAAPSRGRHQGIDASPRGMDSVMFTVHTESPITQLPAALESKVKRRQGNELVLQLHRRDDAIADVVDALRTHGAVITDLHTEKPDLEDVFLELTRKERRP